MESIHKHLMFVANEIKNKVKDETTAIYLMHLINTVRTCLDNVSSDNKEIKTKLLCDIKTTIERMYNSQSNINQDLTRKMSRVTIRRLFYMIRHIGLQESLAALATEYMKFTEANLDEDVVWYLNEIKLEEKLKQGN